MQASRLYRTIAIACIGGFTWIGYQYFRSGHGVQEAGGCLIKHVTGVPCPSCGTSRSVLSILEGNFAEAFMWNPLGYVMAAALVIIPVWLLMDAVKNNVSFFNFYKRAEGMINMKWTSVLLIALVAINWLWNISKGV